MTFFQRILLDKEIVPKILVLKYILEFFDGAEHQKRDYDSAYTIFAAASLFILFARKKDGEIFYKIVQAKDWIGKLNEWIKTFVSGIELTKGRMRGGLSLYRRRRGDEQYVSVCPLQSFSDVYNYFVFKTNAAGEKYVSINNGDELFKLYYQ